VTGDFNLDLVALNRFVNTSAASAAIFQRVANDIRDEARVNAEPITSKTEAIESEMGTDALGIYADVGYRKRHPGFFLWWWEVGTRRHAARPHLRPTLRRRF
jgi:transcriptional regulator GlxA family with amidase domain